MCLRKFFSHCTTYLIPGIFFISCKTQQPVAVVHQPKKDTVTVVKPVEEKKEEIKKEIKTFKLGLLMPFNFSKNLDQSISDLQLMELDPGSVPSIQFYEGAKLAADSLSAKLKIKFDIYDSAVDTFSLMNLLGGEKLYENEALITSLSYPANQAAVEKAGKRNEKIILTQPGNVTPNALSLLATASTNTQCKAMAQFLAAKFIYDRFVILCRGNKRETELADFFYSQIDSSCKAENRNCKITKIIYGDKELEPLIDSMSLVNRNVVIITSSDEAFVSPVLNTLNDTLQTYRIVVAGLPTWENFESIELQVLQNLQTHIFSAAYLDAEQSRLKMFRKKFISKYKSYPVYAAYQGFFLTYFLGEKFMGDEKLWWEKAGSLNQNDQSLFDFKKNVSNNSWENQNVFILKFENFQLARQNR